MEPELTVVTITYNKGESNRRATESVLAQSFGNFRYLLVDDGSTDETDAILSSFTDPRLVHTRQENTGFIGSIIKCMDTVDTPFVAIHGAGDVSLPERFERQLAFLKEHPEVGAVGAAVRWNCNGKVSNPKPRDLIRYDRVEQMIERNIIDHGDVMMRTSAYRAAGGYRPFFRFAQDRDLWLRILEHAQIAKLPDVLYEKVVIPNSNITGDPVKSEKQALLSAFARYLARMRMREGCDPLESRGESAFDAFCRDMSPDEKVEIADHIVRSATFGFHGERATRNMSQTIRAVARYAPRHPKVRELRRKVWEIRLGRTGWRVFRAIEKRVMGGARIA